eukprot:GHVR01028400.1.p1 GENE.GHVR01028400.1~~GHVR01028400.1.p1  ORF type:complete len:258 (-),score=118.28 GHVR01028400.1:129-902(-)
MECPECGRREVEVGDDGQYTCISCGVVVDGMHDMVTALADEYELAGGGGGLKAQQLLLKNTQSSQPLFNDNNISNYYNNNINENTEDDDNINEIQPHIDDDNDNEGGMSHQLLNDNIDIDINTQQCGDMYDMRNILYYHGITRIRPPIPSPFDYLKGIQLLLREITRNIITHWGVSSWIEVEIRRLWEWYLRKAASSGQALRTFFADSVTCSHRVPICQVKLPTLRHVFKTPKDESKQDTHTHTHTHTYSYRDTHTY